ncbi:MAG: xanthine phosphoribosyltransferase [Candidatus Melainabacteria bacterium]|nr:xanthine phosphoribosyltransferase [Candidatus Melainabacteria bacterium]
MEVLKERILKDGKVLGGGILKVDSFMNHQIDPLLMKEIGEEFFRIFADTRPTRILTAETSGIAPALAAGMCLAVPIVFARKNKPVTMARNDYRESAASRTHGGKVELVVSCEYLDSGDRVLILDDFLATASTLSALVRLTESSGATVVGIGTVIEKSFEGGRRVLSGVTCPVVSLAVIDRFDGDRVVFGDC